MRWAGCRQPEPARMAAQPKSRVHRPSGGKKQTACLRAGEKKAARTGRLGSSACVQAAVSHIAVSKALLISGMFMPKFGLTPFFGTATFGAGLSATTWVISARSPDPISRERATEKNRNT
jgi:hypothetical protein